MRSKIKENLKSIFEETNKKNFGFNFYNPKCLVQ